MLLKAAWTGLCFSDLRDWPFSALRYSRTLAAGARSHAGRVRIRRVATDLEPETLIFVFNKP